MPQERGESLSAPKQVDVVAFQSLCNQRMLKLQQAMARVAQESPQERLNTVAQLIVDAELIDFIGEEAAFEAIFEALKRMAGSKPEEIESFSPSQRGSHDLQQLLQMPRLELVELLKTAKVPRHLLKESAEIKEKMFKKSESISRIVHQALCVANKIKID